MSARRSPFLLLRFAPNHRTPMTSRLTKPRKSSSTGQAGSYYCESACRKPFLPSFQALNHVAMKLRISAILAMTCVLRCALAQSPVLLTAFTNPVPSKDDLFGNSVVALGSDRVIIGASGRTSAYTNPAVYLFTTNGQWLTTFTNPTPTDNKFYGR